MTDSDLRHMLMNPFGSSAWKVLDEAERETVEYKADTSLYKATASELGSTGNFVPVFLTEKTLKLYSTSFNMVKESSLEEFETALKQDAQSRSY